MISAMVFAAGKGTRLGELGKNIPKAMLELNGKPLIYHILKKLKSNNVNHVVINLMHLGDQIEEYLKTIDLKMEINFSVEEELLETGGGLKKAAKFFENSSQVIVHNADIYSEIDLQLLLNENTKNKRDVTLAVQDRDSSRKLLFSGDDKLSGWKNFKTDEVILMNDEKIANEYAFSGIQCISNKFVKDIAKYSKDKFSIVEFYLSLSEENNKTYGLNCSSSVWFDLGSEEKLNRAKSFFLK